jgi:hypothetical protein
LEEHPDLFNMLKIAAATAAAAAAASIAIQGVAIVSTITVTTTSLVVPVVTNLILPIAIPIMTSVGSATYSVIKYGIHKVYSTVPLHRDQEICPSTPDSLPEPEDLDLDLDSRPSKDLPPAIT